MEPHRESIRDGLKRSYMNMVKVPITLKQTRDVSKMMNTRAPDGVMNLEGRVGPSVSREVITPDHFIPRSGWSIGQLTFRRMIRNGPKKEEPTEEDESATEMYDPVGDSIKSLTGGICPRTRFSEAMAWVDAPPTDYNHAKAQLQVKKLLDRL